MAKIELKFLLDETEIDDTLLMKRITKLSDISCMLFELKHNFIRGIEHTLDDDSSLDPIDVMREKLSDLFNDYNITEDIL